MNGFERDLVTKHDLENAVLKLEAKIDRVDAKLIGELNLVKWMAGALLALAVANFAKQYF